MGASTLVIGPPALPNGWFALGFSDELRCGGVRACRLHGRELVLFRTGEGRLALLDAHCPHLGAHLGHGGSVVGETIRCPFHGFRFAAGGDCVATEYGCAPPRTARVGTWPVREVGGVIMAWADAGERQPAFEIPQLDTRGWTRWYTRSTDFAGHPQASVENGIDLGHFAVVHGYEKLTLTAPFVAEGPSFRVGYAMRRPRRQIGLALPALHTDFTLDVWGLGWVHVDVDVVDLGMRMRMLVLYTPTDTGRVRLRTAASVSHVYASTPVATRTGRWLRRLPARGVAGAMARMSIIELWRDVAQDKRIWEHQVYRPRPALAASDELIGPFRRWARQFYPTPAATVTALPAEPAPATHGA